MNAEQIGAMMDDMRLFAETMGGLRSALIAQGFDEVEAAEIVIITLRNQGMMHGAGIE